MSSTLSSRHSMDNMETKENTNSIRSMQSGMTMNETKMKPSPSPHPVCGEGVDIDLRGIPQFILDLQQIQPTLNIMTCGDVSHGKSTLLKALSGESTGKDSREKRRNMTIRLGYTSCKIWKCLQCPRPQCYFSTHSDLSTKKVQCSHCGAKPDKTHGDYHNGTSKVILLRHLSFVDVPGHAELMQTMVSATSVADAAILVVDASKSCPGKQTEQHMEAVHLLGLMKYGRLIVAQNKVDLINRQRACLSFGEIRGFLGSFGDREFSDNAPIIPISAQSKLNIDALCHYIIHSLPKYSSKLVESRCEIPRSIKSSIPDGIYGNGSLRANVIRSFDVNKSRDVSSIEDIDKIKGGVLGSAILSGHVHIGQMIQVRPGYIIKKKTKKMKDPLMDRLQPQWSARPICTVVKSLQYGKIQAGDGFPGGNVGIQTNIDPSLTKADGLCGHVIVAANDPNPPPIFNKFKMSVTFLRRQKQFKCNKKQFEFVRLNIGAFKMKAEVVQVGVGDYDGILCVLEAPICARIGDKVGICRQNKQREWAFVGGGIIRETCNIQIDDERKEAKDQTVNASKSSMDTIKEEDRVRVDIRYQQRTARKGITMVVGLPTNIKIKKLVKIMKKEWSTGATIVEDEISGTVIQLQGDLRHLVGPLLVKNDIVKKSQIMTRGV